MENTYALTGEPDLERIKILNLNDTHHSTSPSSLERLRKNSTILNKLKRQQGIKAINHSTTSLNSLLEYRIYKSKKNEEQRLSMIEKMLRLPQLKDVPGDNQAKLFLDKLKACEVLFDFRTDEEKEAKEFKGNHLRDLIEFIVLSSIESTNIYSYEVIYSAMLKVFSTNVFRTLAPHANPVGDEYDQEEDEPIFNPNWEHLSFVYELFIRFIDAPDFNVNIGSKCIDIHFVNHLLSLFDNEDPRERELLKTTLHRVYGKFLHLRSHIRKMMGNYFIDFIFEYNGMGQYGITELLEILGSIINGFATPLKEEHTHFLFNTLMPLHKGKSLSLYYPHLLYCINQYCLKDPSLISQVLISLFKMWPITNSTKQLLFISEIEELINKMNSVSFKSIKLKLFHLLGNCFKSPHFQLAERALYIWNNERFLHLLSTTLPLSDILPSIYPTLWYFSKSHWNKTIYGLAMNALKKLMEIDSKSFDEYKTLFDTERKESEKSSSNICSTLPNGFKNSVANEDEDTFNCMKQEKWNRLEELLGLHAVHALDHVNKSEDKSTHFPSKNKQSSVESYHPPFIPSFNKTYNLEIMDDLIHIMHTDHHDNACNDSIVFKRRSSLPIKEFINHKSDFLSNFNQTATHDILINHKESIHDKSTIH